MNLYSYRGAEPQVLPESITLSSRLTRTDSTTYTTEELADAEYVVIEQEKPYPTMFQKTEWTGTSWILVDMTPEEKEQTISNNWGTIWQKRDFLIRNNEWRIFRYQSQIRLGITPEDDISKIDTYIQALRDITKQADSCNIIWPVNPFDNNPTL